MAENSTIRCKQCGEFKNRLLAGKYPDGKNNKWVDDQGRQFNGNVCPECHSKMVYERKRLKKLNKYV